MNGMKVKGSLVISGEFNAETLANFLSNSDINWKITLNNGEMILTCDVTRFN